MRNFRAAGVMTALVLALPGATTAAMAFELSGPITRGNLSVYWVREAPSASAPIDSLDTAIAQGRATVLEQPRGYSVVNLSDAPIFAPFGSLLRGGSQDQIIGASQIIPPHSAGTPIVTYCVDPFRTTQRGEESLSALVGETLQTPSRTQKLNMLVGAGGYDGAVAKIRQAGVWWGIDTLRNQLAAQTGAPLAPARPEHWAPATGETTAVLLRDRKAAWTDGLTLALEDPRLAAIEAPIREGLTAPADLGDDVVGAAFVVNGQWVGAETYQSHRLFLQMWPALLRGYVIDSIAERGAAVAPPPSVAAMKATLETAGAGAMAPQHALDMQIEDGRSSVVASVADAQGNVVAKTFVPKTDPTTAALTPDGVFVQALDSGAFQGRAIDTLSDAPILAHAAEGGNWKIAEFAPDDEDWSYLEIASVVSWVGFLSWLGFCLVRALRPVLRLVASLVTGLAAVASRAAKANWRRLRRIFAAPGGARNVTTRAV